MKIVDDKEELVTTKLRILHEQMNRLKGLLDDISKKMEAFEDDSVPFSTSKLGELTTLMESVCQEMTVYQYFIDHHMKVLSN